MAQVPEPHALAAGAGEHEAVAREAAGGVVLALRTQHAAGQLRRARAGAPVPQPQTARQARARNQAQLVARDDGLHRPTVADELLPALAARERPQADRAVAAAAGDRVAVDRRQRVDRGAQATRQPHPQQPLELGAVAVAVVAAAVCLLAPFNAVPNAEGAVHRAAHEVLAGPREARDRAGVATDAGTAVTRLGADAPHVHVPKAGGGDKPIVSQGHAGDRPRVLEGEHFAVGRAELPEVHHSLAIGQAAAPGESVASEADGSNGAVSLVGPWQLSHGVAPFGPHGNAQLVAIRRAGPPLVFGLQRATGQKPHSTADCIHGAQRSQVARKQHQRD